LISECGILLWYPSVSQANEEIDSLRTLAGGINHFDETHAIVDYELFAVGIFYRWIVSLEPLVRG
jgi:hypothetical protein